MSASSSSGSSFPVPSISSSSEESGNPKEPQESSATRTYHQPTVDLLNIPDATYADIVAEAGPSWIPGDKIQVIWKGDDGQWVPHEPKSENRPRNCIRETVSVLSQSNSYPASVTLTIFQCHTVSISVLKHFEAMDKYWDERLPYLTTQERHAIIRKLRLDPPLIVADKDVSSQALLGSPTFSTFKVETQIHPKGHGLIAREDTYNLGAIKIDRKASHPNTCLYLHLNTYF